MRLCWCDKFLFFSAWDRLPPTIWSCVHCSLLFPPPDPSVNLGNADAVVKGNFTSWFTRQPHPYYSGTLSYHSRVFPWSPIHGVVSVKRDYLRYLHTKGYFIVLFKLYLISQIYNIKEIALFIVFFMTPSKPDHKVMDNIGKRRCNIPNSYTSEKVTILVMDIFVWFYSHLCPHHF